MLIKEMQEGMHLTFTGLIKTVTLGMTKGATPSEYLDIIMRDTDDREIFVKYWSVPYTVKEIAKPMTVVTVKGEVTMYNGKKQIKAVSLEYALLEEDLDIFEFIKSAPYSADKLLATIESVVTSLTDPVLSKICSYIYNKKKALLLTSPASESYHHNYYSGLTFHKVSMLKIASILCKQRKIFNEEMLYTAIVLHDIAKPEEFEHTYGVVQQYTFKGKMLGHIAMVYGWTVEAALAEGIDLDDETLIHLQHILLSHHGQKEWGSPVTPLTIEAIAMHWIDNIDAKLQKAEDVLSTVDVGEWSEYVRELDSKSIYNHGTRRDYVKKESDKKDS